MIASLLLLSQLVLPPSAERITPELAAAMALARPSDKLPAIVVMRERYDTQSLIEQAERLRKHERPAFARSRLEPFALESQAALLSEIVALKAQGQIGFDELLWTCNAHLVSGTTGALLRLAAIPGVERLSYDPPLPLEEVEDVGPSLSYSIGTLPYSTSFETGTLPAEFEPNTGNGQVQVSSANGPSDGLYHMTLDGSGAGAFAFCHLHLDLSSAQGATLTYDVKSFDTAADPEDGLFLLVGLAGGKIDSFPSASGYQTRTVDLGLAAAQVGMTFSSDTHIVFAWGGSATIPNQGFAIDKISVVQSGPPGVPPEPNITALQAPLLWAVGIEGQGATILTIDSGVDATHPALAPQIWTNTNEIPNNGLDDDNNGKIDDTWGWDFFGNDNDPTPFGDDHGNNTAGIVCGNGANNGGAKTGMAPKTELAVARTNGEGNMLSAYQYAVATGFDCITSSHSIKWLSTPNYPLFRASTDAELAAGIIHANSVGNQGALLTFYPVPYNIAAPANSPGPWRDPQQAGHGGLSSVLGCAGIYLGSDALYFEGSLGPAAWEDIAWTNPGYPYPQNPAYWDYVWAAGTLPGLLKPDLAAYTNVKTTSGSSGYNLSFGGTSAATPHVGGALALMVDANESVPPRQISQALHETAIDLGPPGKDNSYGVGKLQVYAAALKILAAVTAYPNEPALGSSVSIDLTGPAGDPFYLAAGFAPENVVTPLGFTISVGHPLIVLASGSLTGIAPSVTYSFPLPADPALQGFKIFLQLFTDDTGGVSGQWLASLVERVTLK